MHTPEPRERSGSRPHESLLERDRELATIDELVASAGAGGGRALLVGGPAGLGKTRLFETALDRARTRDLLVLRAAGSELEP